MNNISEPFSSIPADPFMRFREILKKKDYNALLFFTVAILWLSGKLHFGPKTWHQ